MLYQHLKEVSIQMSILCILLSMIKSLSCQPHLCLCLSQYAIVPAGQITRFSILFIQHYYPSANPLFQRPAVSTIPHGWPISGDERILCSLDWSLSNPGMRIVLESDLAKGVNIWWQCLLNSVNLHLHYNYMTLCTHVYKGYLG